MRSPQTMGLEWARPGTGVFQPMLAPVLTFHVNGRFWRSAAPEAPGPRNAGQFCASAEKARRNNSPRNLPTSIIYGPQFWWCRWARSGVSGRWIGSWQAEVAYSWNASWPSPKGHNRFAKALLRDGCGADD